MCVAVLVHDPKPIAARTKEERRRGLSCRRFRPVRPAARRSAWPRARRGPRGRHAGARRSRRLRYELGPTCGGRAKGYRHAGWGASAHRLVERLADDLVETDLSAVAEGVAGLHVEVDPHCSSRPDSRGQLPHGRGEATLVQGGRLDPGDELAQVGVRLARDLRRPRQDRVGGRRVAVGGGVGSSSSICAIAASDCTGPSWINSASLRRSSRSAASRSESASCMRGVGSGFNAASGREAAAL